MYTHTNTLAHAYTDLFTVYEAFIYRRTGLRGWGGEVNFKKKIFFFTCVTSRYLAACLRTSVVDLGMEFVQGLLRFVESLIPTFP